MKTRAAVAVAARQPLEIVEIDLEGPKAGAVLGEIMATGTLIVLPVIVFALIVSKHLVQGLTMGAVK